METLFSKQSKPLPARLIPNSFDEFVGQRHLVAPGKPLRKLVESNRLFSVIFYGPPGTGKTALARLIAKRVSGEFRELNAVMTTVQELKKVLGAGRRNLEVGRRTILFLDEIHRFNKAQQDALLPDLEEGNVILVGATTENPYFSLVPALRSRVKVYKFNPLSEEELKKLYRLAVSDSRGLPGFSVPDDVLDFLVRVSGGDGRRFLSLLEELYFLSDGEVPSMELAEEAVGEPSLKYSRGDEHYDVISAFIKSMRGSDPDAALYYLAKMLKAGEDPLFIARRIVIFASEDVGNADPQALWVAVSALHAVEKVGMPEAAINLAHAVIYLSLTLKSNAVYKSLRRALKDVESGIDLPVPEHLKTRSKKYKYPHDYPRHYVEQDYLSEKRKYYRPDGIGFEKELLKFWKWMRGEN